MSDTRDFTRLAAPRAPDAAAPYRFPLVATLAPVAASVAIWLLTSSPFALVFAALGPVTALASLLDSRLGSRRTAKREARRFAEEIEHAHDEVRRRHAREVAALSEVSPDAASLVSRRGADPYRWVATAASAVSVTLGRGAVHSALELDRVGTTTSLGVASELEALAAAAATIHDGPVLVDARLGIGVAGSGALASALARALVVQLAWALSPAIFRVSVAEVTDESGWLRALPHDRDPAPAPGVFAQFTRDSSVVAMVALAGHQAALPGTCRVVVRVADGGLAEIAQHPQRDLRREFVPGIVSREQATSWADQLAADATREGLASRESAVPGAVHLAHLLRPPHPAGDGSSLACEVAATAAGSLTLDLVEHGPHAIVGGTTGSGKSELLIAWVLAMAAAYPPERVTFLLVDFKGGSAFAALDQLPHTVGIITDLDVAQAARALASLRAELRFRERSLAEAGARDIAQLHDLPRLVIVVDEFAAMLADHPDLHALFSDIAARGRSLGVHLVLCTQRPGGVVRDAVLANADLRVSLRVNNRADSSAVVGTDSAAAISAESRGRAIVSLAGGEAQLAQFAIAAMDDAPHIAARWPVARAPRRPWVEPLPPVIRLEDVAPGAFGLLDLPNEQRRAPALWNPGSDGHLLVIGAPGSGKTNALVALVAAASGSVAPSASSASASAPVPASASASAFASAFVEWMPSTVDAAWDAMARVFARLESADEVQEVVLVLDDVDSLLPRFSVEHRAVFCERLGRVLRDGGRRGIRVVISAQRLVADTQTIAAAVPERLMLRHASRQDWVMAGGDGGTFIDALPAGGGVWRSHRVQVARLADRVETAVAAEVAALTPDHPLAIVSTRAVALAGRLRSSHTVIDLSGAAADPGQLVIAGGRVQSIVIGGVDEWQSRWGALAAISQVADVIFDGCSLADFRALTRSRELPPPISTPGEVAWLLGVDGTPRRARLPT